MPIDNGLAALYGALLCTLEHPWLIINWTWKKSMTAHRSALLSLLHYDEPQKRSRRLVGRCVCTMCTTSIRDCIINATWKQLKTCQVSLGVTETRRKPTLADLETLPASGPFSCVYSHLTSNLPRTVPISGGVPIRGLSIRGCIQRILLQIHTFHAIIDPLGTPRPEAVAWGLSPVPHDLHVFTWHKWRLQLKIEAVHGSSIVSDVRALGLLERA